MTVVFHELQSGTTYTEIGRIADGQITAGEDELTAIGADQFADDPERLLQVYDGPQIVAGRPDEADDVAKDETDTIEYETREIEFYDADQSQRGGLLARVANTPAKRDRGLAAEPELGAGEALLLAWPDEDRRTITMAPLDFPIDIVFADATGEITAIESATPDHPDVEARAKWVAELPEGYCADCGLQVGDELALPSTSSSIQKAWVRDPSSEASQPRWRNTETGDYRYQETKPQADQTAPAPGDVGDEDPATDERETWTPDDFDHLTLEPVGDGLSEGDRFVVNWRGDRREGIVHRVGSTDMSVTLRGHGGAYLNTLSPDDDVEIVGRVVDNREKPEPQADSDAHPLSIEAADELADLNEVGASTGVSAPHMDVAKYPDGRKAFVTHVGWDGEDTTEAERAMAAATLFEALGYDEYVPDHYYDRDRRYFTVAAFDGEEAYSADADMKEAIDRDDYLTFAAVNILAGNSDAHGDNVMVDGNGTLSAIDLDHAGGNFATGSKYLDRGLQYLKNTGRTLGLDVDTSEIHDRAREITQQIDDPDAVVAEIENSHVSDKDRHQFRENIRQNIDAFADGAAGQNRRRMPDDDDLDLS